MIKVKPHSCVQKLLVSDLVVCGISYHTRAHLECDMRHHKQRDLIQVAVLLSRAKFRSCLCQTCTNFGEMTHALLKLARSLHIDISHSSPIQSIYDLSNSSLCKKEERNNACLQRQCAKCGVDSIEPHLAPFRRENKRIIQWHHGENTTAMEKKGKGGKK